MYQQILDDSCVSRSTGDTWAHFAISPIAVKVIMRLFKLTALATLVGAGAYVTTLAIVPPKKSVAAGPPTELFSLEILRLAKSAPEGAYDAH
jgi:hypothetical protein